MSLISGNELSEDTKNVSEKLSLFMKQPGVSEVLEWTFMYDKQSIFDETPYNTTFFDVIGGISYQEWKEQKITSEQLILDVNSKFTAWIRELEEIRSNLSIEGITSEKTILDGEGIDFIIVGIQTAKSATIIELEKSSKTPILTSYERQRFCSEVESGQEKLYGSKISENMEESMMSLDLLCREFSENGENLTQEQQKRFLEIYDNLKKKVEEHWEGANFEALDILRFQKKPILQHNFTKEALEKIKNIKIPRDIYMRLWQGYIDAMGLHQKVVSNPNASSIYDGPSTLEVPDSSGYDSISLKRVLELMVHEIGAHYVNQAISEQNGFSIRGAKNIEKEEGLAIVLEHLLEGKKLIDIKGPGYSFPYILAGEYLSKDDRQDLVDLRLKMDGTKGDEGHRRDLRVTRGYPLDGPGSQRKDASYGRGANKIVDLVTSGKCSLIDFYKGKFSIDDIASGRLDTLISKEKIVFPLFFPEMLLFMVGIGRQGFTHENFMAYMQEKYAGDISVDDLNNVKVVQAFSKLKIFVMMWRDIENYLPIH